MEKLEEEEDDDEQKFTCKLCNKIFLCGRSLGGHMRWHLPLIAASKKKVEIITDCENDDHHDYGFEENQDSSIEIENQDSSIEIENQDPNKSGNNQSKPLELFPCEKYSKKLSSSRALSGHIRTDSKKLKRFQAENICTKCDKSFDSIKALSGHMKAHSRKSKASSISNDGLSEFEIRYPKKKRSITRYKESASVLEIDEADADADADADAAACLIMLSMGVRESGNDANSSEFIDKFITKFDSDDSLCHVEDEMEVIKVENEGHGNLLST